MQRAAPPICALRGSAGNRTACDWNDRYVPLSSGARTSPSLLPLQPCPPVPAEVAFKETLNRLGQMRPDGKGSAREWYERNRQNQHRSPSADRSEGGARNRKRNRGQNSPHHKQYARNRIVWPGGRGGSGTRVPTWWSASRMTLPERPRDAGPSPALPGKTAPSGLAIATLRNWAGMRGTPRRPADVWAEITQLPQWPASVSRSLPASATAWTRSTTWPGCHGGKRPEPGLR
jgi:hypothetical protein